MDKPIVRNESAGKTPTKAGRPTDSERTALTKGAIGDMRDRWLILHNALHAGTDTSLALRMDSFVEVMREFMTNNYPLLDGAPDALFWNLVSTAVRDSGTHAPAEIEAAIGQTRAHRSR